jgi:hypothetical protein
MITILCLTKGFKIEYINEPFSLRMQFSNITTLLKKLTKIEPVIMRERLIDAVDNCKIQRWQGLKPSQSELLTFFDIKYVFSAR